MTKIFLSDRSSLPHFGECLKKIHAQKGISQREIAEKIGMDAGNYNRLLNRPSMSASTLWSICQALGVSFGDLA
jgi:DNA-binding Xre family transcriptional regulator